MSKDRWPEEERWPGEQLGEAFRRGATEKGQVRMIHQGPEEPEPVFRARLATTRASEQPEALWVLVVRE